MGTPWGTWLSCEETVTGVKSGRKKPHGYVFEVDATSERERFRFDRMGIGEELECAVTPGMPSFLFTRTQLEEFSEKTGRWPGHWEGSEMFKESGRLSRELGVALGLPHDMVYRHPFPGPGLGVRILGEVKREFADLLRRADAIFIEELHASGWYEKTSQAFAVFLPVKSVGVMGDGRTYDYVVALRAVVTSDFMTAHWAELPYTLLGKVSNRIINEVRGINRVVYDISSKPPSTIEWE
jgi:hypothetical protein